MTRALATISLSVLLASVAFGQPSTPKPSFDIADVHISPRSTWVKKNTNNLQGGVLNAGRYELRRATMLDLIRTAYAVDADKVYGGPSWLDYDRFEVVAEAPAATRAETLRLMLQSLLADRFKLVVKMDTKPAPAYVLGAGKDRSKLKASDGTGPSGCAQNLVTPIRDVPEQKIQCSNVTMDTFATELRRFASARLTNLPIANATGFEGTWDIELQYGAVVTRINVGRSAAVQQDTGLGIAEAISKQLGLTLTLGTAPQQVLAVESVNQQPSANPPGVAASLPPLPPPVFEVASIRPCDGTAGASINLRFEAGGRVTAQCMPLMSLLTQAWSLAPFEQPVGVPKWLTDASNSTIYNMSIVAKAPEGNFTGGVGGPDRDALNAMLRTLLLERYQMKVHYEDRPMDALTLVASRPKLTKADPSNRTNCTRQNPSGGDPLALTLVCQNITLAQFAEQMQSYDSNIFYPVLDGTGIEGAWDFTLNYSIVVNLLPRFVNRAGGTPTGEAPEPSSTISFIEAIDKQLGLKVVTNKRPEPVLVIEHMEEKPTEN